MERVNSTPPAPSSEIYSKIADIEANPDNNPQFSVIRVNHRYCIVTLNDPAVEASPQSTKAMFVKLDDDNKTAEAIVVELGEMTVDESDKNIEAINFVSKLQPKENADLSHDPDYPRTDYSIKTDHLDTKPL